MASVFECEKKRLKIVLDTNAWFVPLQFRIDIFQELGKILNVGFEPVLLSPVKRELEKIFTRGSPEMQRKASYALKLAEKCKFFELDPKYSSAPDDSILKIAKEWNCPVFTNDRELRKKLRNINVPVIYVRQKSRLEIDGRI